jgi:predicted dehydrogenase
VKNSFKSNLFKLCLAFSLLPFAALLLYHYLHIHKGTDMTIHIGILGGGNISQTHARAAQEIGDGKVVAVCGQNREKVAELARTHDSHAYEDLETFLKHKPMDVVLIGSPSGLHAEHGTQAARQGLHVLMEKPIAITTQQTDALIAECGKAGVKLGVFFQDRVAPDIVKLKGLVDGGRLGKPILASAHVKWYRPPEYYRDSRWRGIWALDGGGALMNQGVHTVDLMLSLMGGVDSLWAKAITALHDIEVEDTVVAALQFSSGALGTLEAATSVYPGFSRRLELTGSQGTIILENDRILSANLRQPLPEGIGEPPSLAERSSERSVSPTISDTTGHRKIIEDFLQAIRTDGRPLCDGSEGRRSVELIEAIYRSSQTGEMVTLASQ